MKNLKDIKSDIKDLKKDLEMCDEVHDKRRFNKIKKQLVFARLVKMYLETEPREDFIKSELTRLHAQIAAFDKKYTAVGRKEKAEKAKEYGLSLMKKQSATLQYIIH